jgi:hypothetical protein
LDLGREVAVLGPITDAERRIAELVAEGAQVWKLNHEISRSRHTIRRAVIKFHQSPIKEPVRSPLRLSPAEREEISRGLAAGVSVRRSRAGPSICLVGDLPLGAGY